MLSKRGNLKTIVQQQTGHRTLRGKQAREHMTNGRTMDLDLGDRGSLEGPSCPSYARPALRARRAQAAQPPNGGRMEECSNDISLHSLPHATAHSNGRSQSPPSQPPPPLPPHAPKVATSLGTSRESISSVRACIFGSAASGLGRPEPSGFAVQLV